MRSCGEAFLVAFLALARAPASGKSKILKGTIMLNFIIFVQISESIELIFTPNPREEKLIRFGTN